MAEEVYYKLYLYLAHTGAVNLHNVTEKNLKKWNDSLLAGAPFTMDIGKDGHRTPWFINPEFVIHTESYVQEIGDYWDDPRSEQARNNE